MNIITLIVNLIFKINFLYQTTKWSNNMSITKKVGFFTIKKSDTFLSDYLTDLKLHSTK